MAPTGPRVLIVEDDPAMTELLCAVLAPFCDVRIEPDGLAGLDAFRRALLLGRPYELVCLDLHMPGMDGRRALRAMRRLEATHAHEHEPRHRTRIVMMTSERDRESVVNALAAGVDSYIVKPFLPTELLARLGLSAPSEVPAAPSAEAAS